jgi:hypothetical protein
MYGMTENVYHAWLRQHGKSVRRVRQITLPKPSRSTSSSIGCPAAAQHSLLASTSPPTGFCELRHLARSQMAPRFGRRAGPGDGQADLRHPAQLHAVAEYLEHLRPRPGTSRSAIEAKGVAWALTAANDNSDLVKHQLGVTRRTRRALRQLSRPGQRPALVAAAQSPSIRARS